MNRMLLAVLTLFAPADKPASLPDVEPPAYCPAVTYVRQIPNALPGPPMPVEFVAIIQPQARPPRVQVRPGDAVADDRDVVEADVVATLYGHSDERRIRIHWPSSFPERPVIVGLAGHLYEPKGTYDFKFAVDVDDRWAQQALAEARLDMNVLGATAIIVGRERPSNEGPIVELRDDHRRWVQVDQVLYGPAPVAGDSIIVETPRFPRWTDKTLRLRTEPTIYLLGKIEPSARTGKPIHHLDAWLSAVCEPQVRAALARRNTHPIVEITEKGSTSRVREILFRGGIPDAIRLMGSESEAGVLLGSAKLRHEKAAAFSLIVSEIESELFAQSRVGHVDAFRRQRELIRLLSSLEDPANRESVRLVNHMLERPAADRPPLNPSRSEAIGSLRWRGLEDEDETVNHSLVWLLSTLPQAEAVERFGRRLIGLRDGADDSWRNEFQLALDKCRVGDTLEVAEARRKMEGVKPFRTTTGFWHGGVYQVAFSNDGKHLATVGDGLARVWNTADWSLAAEFRHPENVVGAAFSDDGRSLLIAGDSPKPTVKRVRWRDGTIEPEPVSRKDKALRTLLHADRQAESVDGKRRAELFAERVARAAFGGDVRWSVRILSLPGMQLVAECAIPITHGYRRVHSWALSPDGRTLAVGIDHEPPKLFDADTARLIRVGPAHQADIAHLAFDADDGTLRSFGRDEIVCVWDAKTLHLVKRWEAPTGYGFASARPDGRFALYTYTDDLSKPAKIVDCRTSKVVSELSLPYDRDHNNVNVYWLDDREALAIYNQPTPGVYDQHFRRFNYRTGAVVADLDRHQLPEGSHVPRRGEVTEDGKFIWALDGWKNSVSGVLRTDLSTLVTTKREDIESERAIRGPFLLVPDGKHCLLGTLVYDRATLKRLGGKDPGNGILETAVSADGRRYAVMTGELPYQGSGLSRWDTNSSSVIRVHEIPSGKMLAACSPTIRSARQLTFAPDGSRLAVLREDNVIEVWPLP